MRAIRIVVELEESPDEGTRTQIAVGAADEAGACVIRTAFPALAALATERLPPLHHERT